MEKRFNKIEGEKGEIAAGAYLKKQKYKILDQNYKTKVGEIDIIAQEKKTDIIVFVEVKCRQTVAFGRPGEAVNIHKQAKIRRTAEEYLIKHKLTEREIRFDVIELIDAELNHIKNAF